MRLGLPVLHAEVHGLLPVMAVNIGEDVRPVSPEADQLPVEAGAEAPAHGEHVDGLQQVGLPLGVGPADDVGAGGKLRGLKVIVAKAVEGDFPDDHAFAHFKHEALKVHLIPGIDSFRAWCRSRR